MLNRNKLRAMRAHHFIFLVIAQMAIGIGKDSLDLGPFDIQLFGNHQGHRGHAALTHFRMGNANGDSAIGIQNKPSIHFNARLRSFPRLWLGDSGQSRWHMEAQHQTATGSQRGLDKETT